MSIGIARLLDDGIARDARHALRALRRSPGFAGVALLTLSLGIASVTTAFAVVDTIVLRGLPYRDAGRLLDIFERSDDGSARAPSYPTFRDWESQRDAASAAIDGFAFVRGDAVSLSGGDDKRQIAAYVSPGFFHLMGTRPLLGRTFTADEERSGAAPVAVISYDLFADRFGGDRSILGRTIDVDSIPTTIIGVMPRAFAYPNFGGSYWLPARLWEPIATFDATHPGVLARRELHVDSRAIVRLRADADSIRAAAVMRTIEQRLALVYPDDRHWTSVAFAALGATEFGGLRASLVLIAGAVGLVLLLACANVANLFLVRAGARGREIAVRTALGAGRWRIARQSIMETLIVAIAAGFAGALAAYALLGFVRHSMGAMLPLSARMTLGGHGAAFAAVASLIAAVLVGAGPVLHALSGDVMTRIRGGTSGAIGDRRELDARRVLVAVQFALALTLLIGAGLLIQSFRRLASVPLGYDPRDVIEFAIGTETHRYDTPQAAAALYARIIDAVRAVPGVQQAAASGGALLQTSVEVTDRPPTGQPLVQALYHLVSTDYLRTMRIPLVAGRWFTGDDMHAATGAVINERLAHMLWPGASPLGARITVRRQSQARADVGQPITLPVIGVVSDVREYGPGQDPDAEVYLPYTLEVWPWMTFVARAPHADRVVRSVEAAVRNTEPALRFRERPTVERGGAAGVDGQRRFITVVLAAFAAGALLVAAIGLYGITSYGVARRTREIGVRIALGATRAGVVALVMRDVFAFVAIGVVAGLGGAFAATRLMRAMLFHTTATDPATFGIVTAVLVATALVAAWVPARRAAATDPTIAMKAE